MKNRIYFFLSILSVLLLFNTSNVSAQTEEISPSRKQAIDSLALEKINDLSKYIKIVGNKNTDFSEAKRVTDRAEELFAEGSQIAVSSLSSEKIGYYKVRPYFEHLMALNYDKVNIKWYDIQYVSDLEKQPDGRYVGVITIYQRFEGETADGLKYKDTTKKDITVYVERKQTQIRGRIIDFWDVLLGDIRVVETKS